MTESNKNKSVNILLIEDNPGDVTLIKQAFGEGKYLDSFIVLTDGESAISFLRKEGQYITTPRPDLILLDLNMPRKDGRDVLAEVKTNPALKHIPVIILTSSESQQDITHAYNMQANCYITKPFDLNQYFKVVKLIEDFWLKTVKLP
ncbi:MAG TPA: response regulator [Deltaproteobacteria bacterium]|nr:response regulator [Deltaproteobacteria bacterium]